MSIDDTSGKGISHDSGSKLLVERMSAIIEANLTNEQFSVDNLAQKLQMSRSSLHRKLQKIEGVSTSQFIREYRLKKAFEIMQTEDITASEAAYRVGFSSATYFSTSFHKFYGYTPGEVKSRDNIKAPISHATKATNNSKRSTRWNTSWYLSIIVVLLAISGIVYYKSLQENGITNKTNKTENFEKSIAVLPFKNWTGHPDLEYVSDGMTDAVITRLTKVGSINKVIPFVSTLSYKETKKTVKEIASELDVGKLLQGNLQISGDEIKIKLQLIDVKSNEHIWSQEYTRDWKGDEIFQIQTEVVEGIAEHMNAAIADDELVEIQKPLTKNKQAYSYFLQAEFQWNKGNGKSYQHALELYKKAIAIDPDFVQAYVSIAKTYNWGGLVWGTYDEELAWRESKAHLTKALELDPSNEDALEELHSGYYFFEWNFKEVEKHYQRVTNDPKIKIIPSFCIDYGKKTGRCDEALRIIDKNTIFKPVGYAYFIRGETLMCLGANDEALKYLDDLSLLHSDNQFFLRESAKLYFYLKEHEKSKIQIENLLKQFSDYPPIIMWLNATHAQISGNSIKAESHLDELKVKYEEGSSGSPAWFIALYYAHIQDYDATFEWLEKCYDRHEVEMTWLREEPLLANIRGDQRYVDLYEKVGFLTIGLPIKTSPKN